MIHNCYVFSLVYNRIFTQNLVTSLELSFAFMIFSCVGTELRTNRALRYIFIYNLFYLAIICCGFLRVYPTFSGSFLHPNFIFLWFSIFQISHSNWLPGEWWYSSSVEIHCLSFAWFQEIVFSKKKIYIYKEQEFFFIK